MGRAGSISGHACAGDPSTKVCRELYIGNLPERGNDQGLTDFLNAEMIQKGMVDPSKNTLQSTLPVIQSRINGKFAFVELRSMEETDKALSLNGAVWLGCAIRIGRPRAYQGPEGNPDVIPTSDYMASAQVPTKVLQLSNMVTLEDLKDDAEYEDIKEDILGEMQSFGPVESIEIPRPVEGEEDGPGLLQVYIKFEQTVDSNKAKIELHGRTFGDNDVEASFFPVDKYDTKGWYDVRKGPPKRESSAVAVQPDLQTPSGSLPSDFAQEGRVRQFF